MNAYLRSVARWVLGEEQRLAFYEWDPNGEGRAGHDDEVVEWASPEAATPELRARLFAGANPLSRWRMRRRWRRRYLRFFSLMIDGRLAAVAGIRHWSLYRREVLWLGRPGPILGPHWTDPAHRRRGLHRRLLLHRLHCCLSSGADVVYTSAYVYNLASRRNIERAGFRPRGCVAIRRTCFRLRVVVRPLTSEPARVLGAG